MTVHNFLHIVIVVGGVSDGFLPNGEQLLALNSEILKNCTFCGNASRWGVEVEVSQCPTHFLLVVKLPEVDTGQVFMGFLQMLSRSMFLDSELV